MKIAVFGASGAIGSSIVGEAACRGHDVTAISRRRIAPPDHGRTKARCGDARDLAWVMEIAGGHDVIVTATRPSGGREHELVDVARVMLLAAQRSECRLLVVGGAATLKVPDTGGRLVLDDPNHLPPAARAIARACVAQHDVCMANDAADWTYLSPPAQLVTGRRTGAYRLGTDELLVDAKGASRISIPDLAVAAIDEIEKPRHQRQRFTVAH
jgi:putative NADH-flavin reductase